MAKLRIHFTMSMLKKNTVLKFTATKTIVRRLSCAKPTKLALCTNKAKLFHVKMNAEPSPSEVSVALCAVGSKRVCKNIHKETI